MAACHLRLYVVEFVAFFGENNDWNDQAHYLYVEMLAIAIEGWVIIFISVSEDYEQPVELCARTNSFYYNFNKSFDSIIKYSNTI